MTGARTRPRYGLPKQKQFESDLVRNQIHFFGNFIKEAERAADTHAVNQGMEKYILTTKDFILNNSEIDEIYKSRIIKYYLSPEEIMVLVHERDAIR